MFGGDDGDGDNVLPLTNAASKYELRFDEILDLTADVLFFLVVFCRFIQMTCSDLVWNNRNAK